MAARRVRGGCAGNTARVNSPGSQGDAEVAGWHTCRLGFGAVSKILNRWRTSVRGW